MGFMFITINGHLGSGKSTVCALLQEKYGFSVFSTGSIQREFANSLNISTLELNKKSLDDLSFDRYIDNATVEYAKVHCGENVIFDSRLAWHFVPMSFKVRLTIDPKIAATRVFNHRQSEEERYSSVKEAMVQLSERQNAETERYKSIYGIDINDVNCYDYIVDTSNLTPHEVAELILDNYKQFINDRIIQCKEECVSQNCFISSEFLDELYYPENTTTISIDDIIENNLLALKSNFTENPNVEYYYSEMLAIKDFQNCNGKEVTQKAIVEILTHRIKENLPTHLICDSGFSKLSTVSGDLHSIVKDNFIFLP